MRQAVALLFIAGITAGCASQGVQPESVINYSYDPSASLAKNVADAAGIDGVSDMPREEYEALVAENPELRGIDPRGAVRGSGDAAKLLGATAAGAAGAMDPILGLSDITTGALGALSWLADDNTAPARKNWEIFWLPDGVSIRDFEKSYVEAVAQAQGLNLDDLDLRYEDSFLGKQNISLAPEDCVEPDGSHDSICSVEISHPYYQIKPRGGEIHRSKLELPEPRRAPAFISSDNAVTGPILSDFGWVYYPPESGVVYNHKTYLEMSEHLPDYVFLYVVKTTDGWVAPRVYANGEAHYFIEP
ncbi:hypothetical protein A6K26_007850 [Gammaproteobacteria bacterium 2W06]|nr:hypothetical protein A6K26_007850 [Gammaproteobacteria bacterium 2W06]